MLGGDGLKLRFSDIGENDVESDDLCLLNGIWTSTLLVLSERIATVGSTLNIASLDEYNHPTTFVKTFLQHPV